MANADTLIPKVKAIGAVNKEIISRINAKRVTTVACDFKYLITEVRNQPLTFKTTTSTNVVPLQLKVDEVVVDSSAGKIIDSWQKSVKLQVPIDLFKDKVDYTCEKFSDIERLNGALLTVIEQYLFLDPVRASSEIEKFKNNMEILQTCLGEIEQALVQKESQLEEKQEQVDEINRKIAALFQAPSILHVVDKGLRTLTWADLKLNQHGKEALDEFGVNEQLSAEKVAKAWATALGYRKVVSFTSRTSGTNDIYYLPRKTSKISEAKYGSFVSGITHPVVSNLVVE